MKDPVLKKVDEFFSHYPLKKFEENQIIIHGGDNPNYAFYLVSGNVRQYDISNNGTEVVVNVFKESSFFPLSWIINKTANLYFFDSLGPVEARLAPVEEVLEFIKANGDVSFNLVSRLLSGSSGIQRRMAHLMTSTGYIRVLFELTIECRRFGVKQKDGSLILSMSENELAKRSGLSRETVSHELNKLKKIGLIEIGRKDILIKDLNKIEEALGTNL